MAITYCTVYGQFVDLSGHPVANAPVTFKPNVPKGVPFINTDGYEIDTRGVIVTTGSDGSFSVSIAPSANTIPSGVSYTLTGPNNTSLRFTVPSTANYNPANGLTTAKPSVFGVPTVCLVSGLLGDLTGTLRSGYVLSFGMDESTDNVVVTSSGGMIVKRTVAVTTADLGVFSIPLIPSSSLVPSGQLYTRLDGPNGMSGRFQVPSTAGAVLTSLL